MFDSIFLFFYNLLQTFIAYLFSPAPPQSNERLHGPRIAIIGAGLTGVSAAAHCVSHGSDVTIFESSSKVGGIWTRVNNTSGLQIHSIMYRFHPSVTYSKEYPNREQIEQQIKGVWERYNLQEKTRFNTAVASIERHEQSGKWVVNNDTSLGLFDGIIAAVGTCGKPKCPDMPGLDSFKGQKVHSSQLEGVDMNGKNVSVLGGGASAIEVLEYAAAHGASKIHLLSRSDKWIIPRNPVVDALLSLNVFGFQVPGALSFIPEFLLRKLFYRDLEDLAPAPGKEGLYEGTPMVNSELLEHIRSGQAQWLRGDVKHVDEESISYSLRAQGTPKGGPGKDISVPTDILVYATGFEKPSLKFLPSACFSDSEYQPPNWYLQTFPVSPELSPPGEISAINCTYVSAIGTVGHFHIGVYTRLLLMFLTDPLTRPPVAAMRFWVRLTQWLKKAAPKTGALEFFTYAELCWWFTEAVVVNPFRWKWAPFVIAGWRRPMMVVEKEKDWGSGEIESGPW